MVPHPLDQIVHESEVGEVLRFDYQSLAKSDGIHVDGLVEGVDGRWVNWAGT